MALASGVDPENVHNFLPYINAILVATGVSMDFHNIDPDKLTALVKVVDAHNNHGNVAKAPAADKGPLDSLRAGDRVRIVRGAKKKFLKHFGKLEKKFLNSKNKWGILLDNGHRIALEASCLEPEKNASRKSTKTC